MNDGLPQLRAARIAAVIQTLAAAPANDGPCQ